MDRHRNRPRLPEPKLFVTLRSSTWEIENEENPDQTSEHVESELQPAFNHVKELDNLEPEKQVSPDDARFSHLQLPKLLNRIRHTLELPNNDGTSFRFIYRTLCVIILEFAVSHMEAALEVLKFGLAAQDIVLPPPVSVSDEDDAPPAIRKDSKIRDGHRAAIISLVGSVFNFLIYVSPKAFPLQDYVLSVLCTWLESENDYLLPERAIKRLSLENAKMVEAIESGTVPIFDRAKMQELLLENDATFDMSRLDRSDVFGSMDPMTEAGLEYGTGLDASSVNLSIEMDSDGESLNFERKVGVLVEFCKVFHFFLP